MNITVVNMELRLAGVLFVVLIAGAVAKHEVYRGWKAYSVYPMTKEEQLNLIDISEKFDVDYLKHAVVGRDGVGLVKPEFQTGFEDALKADGIKYDVYSDDVEKTLEAEDLVNEAHRILSRSRNGGKDIPYDAYLNLDTIYNYLHEIAANHPDLVTLVDAGESFEGRPIYYLKISKTNFEVESKPVIFVDGGIHAREWVAPPAATYAIHKLVEDITETDLIDNADWIIHPVVNPDGYEHTFDSYRFWRKTRSTENGPLSTICPGVDGNRNYDHNWNTAGTGLTNCADNYAGPSPFSEPETRIVRDIMHQYLDRMALYISIHSYGSMILYPWGDTGEVSENVLQIHKVGAAMGRAIEENSLPSFPPYAVGNSLLIVGYAAAGGSMDYAHYIGIPLSYTYELPGFGWGLLGFNPDPSLLRQIVTETWAGIAAGARLALASYRRAA